MAQQEAEVKLLTVFSLFRIALDHLIPILKASVGHIRDRIRFMSHLLRRE